MTSIFDLFPHQDILDYTQGIQTPQYLGVELFPAKKVQSNDIKILTSGTYTPTIAHVHAFDTEAELGSRTARSASFEPLYFKRKFQLQA